MRKIIFICILINSLSTIFAQNSQSTSTIGNKALFFEGKELFISRDYHGCITQLLKFKTFSKDVNLNEESDYMLAACAFETNDIDTKKLLVNYLTKYPYSLKNDRIRFLIGTTDFLHNRYVECIAVMKSLNLSSLSSTEQDDCQYRLAYSYLSTDSTLEALNIFRELKRNSPKYGDAATYYCAWYDYKNKAFDNAVSGFEAVKKNPSFIENACFYLTQIHFINHQYSETILSGEAIFSTIKNKSNQSELARIIGESYYRQGETTKAIEYLSKYAEIEDSPLAESMYLLGVSLFTKQEYTKAIQFLKFAAVRNDELGQNAYYYLGCSYLKIGDKKNARLAFEIASRSDFNQKAKELSLYNYAMLIYETDYTGFNEAVPIFELFLNSFPDSKEVDKISSCLSEVYMTSKNFTTVLASIEKIKHPSLKILSAKQRILLQIGIQELINGKVDNARKRLSEAIEMGDFDNENIADAHNLRGEIAFRQSKFSDAASDFQSYLSKTKSNNKEAKTVATYNLGYTYFKTQTINKAQSTFEKALAIGFKKNPVLTADILNRLGDCRYYLKDYAIAEKYYARAAQTSEINADYSLFQQAQIFSLQKQYNSEIKLLDKILSDFPKSEFRDQALFMKAQTYQAIDKKEVAIESYSNLISDFPKSRLIPSAAVQLGMVYLGLNNIKKSIEWYKYTLTTFPESDEANVANEDLKRIYKDQNQISEYAQFLKTLNRKFNFSTTEQDSLMYLGAEKNYMKGNKKDALRNFSDYLKAFPQGAFSLYANYYLAMSYLDQKNDSIATIYLTKILTQPDNKFTETALTYSANISFAKGDYNNAYKLYNLLSQKIAMNKKRSEIWGKLIQCTWAIHKFKETIAIADSIIEEPKSDSELKANARYFRSKSNIALQKTDNLVNDLSVLAADTRNEKGAEAKFLLAEYYYQSDNYKKAETEVFDYIDKGTPHQHWLARSFILLTDIYIKNNDLFQAKQYLLSLKNNYKEHDPEIETMIDERMLKVK
ncbi:MAG: tetratricopeptide repeat protein [Bacteroidales bacterium]